jgi:cyclopropane-fatty-acyl-phospholipid synthase
MNVSDVMGVVEPLLDRTEERLLFAACHSLRGVLYGDRRLSPRENTARCYRFFHNARAAAGIYTDYTEGYYERGDESYIEAQEKQARFFFDTAGVRAGSRVLDVGCGNGRFLDGLKALGAVATGLSIAPENVTVCREKGHDARLASYEEMDRLFAPDSFDVVFFNGATEHFVNELDALEGRTEAIRSELFRRVARVLRPGGRVMIACMHFAREPDVSEVLKSPFELRMGSFEYHVSILLKFYSGWYPLVGDYDRHAGVHGLDKVFERDATADYRRTSEAWCELADSTRWPLSTRLKVLSATARQFVEDPEYWMIFRTYYKRDTWLWQFLPDESGSPPMRHLWLAYRKPAASRRL